MLHMDDNSIARLVTVIFVDASHTGPSEPGVGGATFR